MATSAFLDSSTRHRGLVSRPKRSAEVIVVGGGLSGLQTAYHLQQSGISCLVLEAQDRLGGYLRSVTCAGSRGNANLGGAWISDADHPRAWDLVRSLGDEMIDQHGDEMSAFGEYELGSIPNLDEDDQRSYIRVCNNLEGLSQLVDINDPTKMMPNYGSMTVKELVVSQGATPTVRKLADNWTATIFGLSAKDVSALYFLFVCRTAGGFRNLVLGGSGRKLRCRGGVQQLCDALAKRLQPGSVQLSQTVQWIDQTSSNKCVLTTASGEVFQCSRIVLAVPTSAYKDMEFSPALGEHKQWLQTYEQPGFYKEVILTYDEPWWREQGLNDGAPSLEGPVWEVKDTSVGVDGIYTLTCIVAGEAGLELWQTPGDERREALLQHLGSLYDVPTAFPQPLEILESSRHVPCPLVPVSRLHSVAKDQFGAEDNIHFVGSESSHVWRGFIEGALASASRGAEEVLHILRPVEDMPLLPRL